MITSCSGQPIVPLKERSAFEICDKKVSGRLIAPMTYKVVWRRYNDRGPISFDDYRSVAAKDIASDEARFKELSDWDRLTLAYRKKMRSNIAEDRKQFEGFELDSEKTTGFVVVEYDAQNKLGVPLRSFAFCRVMDLSEQGEFHRVFDFGDVDRATGEEAKAVSLKPQ